MQKQSDSLKPPDSALEKLQLSHFNDQCLFLSLDMVCMVFYQGECTVACWEIGRGFHLSAGLGQSAGLEAE